MSTSIRQKNELKSKRPNENPYPYKGSMMTIMELVELPEAKEAGITKQLLSQRLARGMRTSRAVSMPKKSIFDRSYTTFNRIK